MKGSRLNNLTSDRFRSILSVYFYSQFSMGLMASEMTFSHDHRFNWSISQRIELVDTFAWIVRVLNFLVEGVTGPLVLLAWLIVMVLLISLGLLTTIVSYLPLVVSRKRLKGKFRRLRKILDKVSQRDAMELYSDIDRLQSHLVEAIGSGSHFFVFWPIVYEFKKMSSHISKIREPLFQKAYPGRTDLTREEGEDILRAIDKWEADWRDEKMDVYNG